jgi:phage host-nuclease inhibitor protein Gam
MAKAKSAAVAAPQNQTQARDWMARIGIAERNLASISSVMSEDIARIKEEAENRADPVREQLDDLRKGLQTWAEANRAALTTKSKTVDLGTGSFKWRLRPPSVSIRGTAKIIAAMKAMSLTRFVRVKEEINKDALLAEPEVAAGINGVTIKSAGEDFIIEPIVEDVSAGKAAA